MLLLGMGAPPSSAGQSTADAYFHEAAQEYVAGNAAAARRAVEQGLEVAPSDPRLVALRDKLQQDGRPDGGRDSSSSASSDRSQQDADPSSEEASPGTEETSDAGEEERPQPGARDPSSDESSASGQRSSSQRSADPSLRPDTTGRGGSGRPIDTLSRAQAERLLQALEGQERQLLRRIRTQASEPQRVEKDW